jgi:hypothetical protein
MLLSPVKMMLRSSPIRSIDRGQSQLTLAFNAWATLAAKLKAPIHAPREEFSELLCANT